MSLLANWQASPASLASPACRTKAPEGWQGEQFHVMIVQNQSPSIDMKTKKCRNSIPWTLCLANEHAWALTGDRRVLIPGGKIEQICENKWIRQPDISWHDISQYRDVYYIHILICVCARKCVIYILTMWVCVCVRGYVVSTYNYIYNYKILYDYMYIYMCVCL